MTRHPSKDRSPTALQTYLQEIRQDDLLSADQERELAEAIARGDRDARGRMIRANLRLVVRIARDYTGRGLSLDDLVGEGNLGLIRAAEQYDPSFGTRFSTYASYWIKQAIRHALTNTTATIRLPAHMVNLLSKWRQAERLLQRRLGFPPTPERIARELNMTEAQRLLVERALLASRLQPEGQGGFDRDSSTTDEAPDLHDAPDVALEADERRRDLWQRLERLDDRERTILSLRYGLEGGDPLTLKEVGKRLGVTREWVRKIEVRAVRKLDDREADTADTEATRPRITRRPRLAQLQSA
jgi:RNA polymerase primary sigma factor